MGDHWYGDITRLFSRHRKQDVFTTASEHADKTVAAMDEVDRAIKDLVADELKDMNDRVSRVHELEKEAKSLFSTEMDRLALSGFLPEERHDLMNFLLAIDDVIDAIERQANRLDMLMDASITLPSDILKGLEEMSTTTVSIVKTMKGGIDQLFTDPARARKICVDVISLENDIDRMHITLMKRFLKEAKSLDPSTFYLVKELVYRLEEIADRVEDVADQIGVITSSRTLSFPTRP